MWKCKKCDEEHEDTFVSCWKCGAVLTCDPPSPEDEAVSENASETSIENELDAQSEKRSPRGQRGQCA